jgi:hypothetical protein
MAEDFEDRWRRHEEIMEGLARIWEAQHGRNERLDAWVARQDALNERLTHAIERVDRSIAGIDRTLAQQAVFQSDVRTTLARLETIIARLGQQSANGRDA